MPARKRSKPNPPELPKTTPASTPSQPPSDGVGGDKGPPVGPQPTQEHALADSEASLKSSKSVKEKEEVGSNAQSKSVHSNISKDVETEMHDVDSQPRAVRSWYGTWQTPAPETPSKKNDKQEVPSGETKLAPPVRRSTPSYLSPGASSRSLPLTSTTRLHISSDGSPQASETAKEESLTVKGPLPSKSDLRPQKNEVQPSSASTVSNPSRAPSTKSNAATTDPAPPWTTWFGKQRPDPQVSVAEPKQVEHSVQKGDTLKGKDGESSTPAAADFSVGDTQASVKAIQHPKENATTVSRQEPALRPKSWLGLWPAGKSTEQPRTLNEPETSDSKKPQQIVASDDKMEIEKTTDPTEELKSQKAGVGGEPGTGWAFWSRSPANASKGDQGELAVAGSSSQSKPEDAICGQDGVPTSVTTPTGAKRARPVSLEAFDDTRSISSRKSMPVDKKTADLASDTPPKTPPQRPVSRKEDRQHLLLPLFNQTYPVEPECPNFLQQISRLFYGKPTNSKHPLRLREPQRIKNALSIGVHGYFPASFMQTVLGRPTGTSLKFAEAAARAIHRYAEKHQHSPISVEKIALEGEGRIEERLDILWKLLLNWIDKIRRADFIILACHSQGVPVAISLAAKLIGFGCVNGARIGVCAMAGVNLGPFVDYKSRFIGGSAGELFEFARPDSMVSKAYETALDTVLRFGAKVVYIGSMDDQLVSLQSSTFGTAEHPSIYRAVWIDGRVHMSDFLTHLVGFALKLRNLGVSDHGLVRELSNPLAGSLVGGEGHSRVYEDDTVYDLAVEFTAGTTSLHTNVLNISKGPSTTSQNPYILPFAMRGLLEEEFVRTELASEAMELLKQFDNWRPTTKVLRDVKYRLEGVRSKL